MIIVRLSGGLGNQIFQYAAGRALAISHSTDLALDVRALQTDKLRRFALRPFSLKTVSLGKVRLPPSRRNPFAFVLWRITTGRCLTYHRERNFLFDPGVLSLGSDVYLHGYWQSEKYFRAAADAIRADLVVTATPSELNAARLHAMTSSLSVSVHVRRGDYAADPETNAIYGTCTVDYYQAAARLLAEKLGAGPVFWIFSDDSDWAAANVKLPFASRYVTNGPGEQPAEDLRLMSACRHHIMANSTFSWWGAWLNPSPDKLIVAPRRWFKDSGRSDHDLVSENWIRL
jgi:hypothetical protein